MSPESCEILPGALFLSDAHFSHRRPQLLPFLQSVADGSLSASQLILMGDIFDLLFGEVRVTLEMNAACIEVLRRIGERMPLLYLEGNHDYNLATLFPAATVVPLHRQPFRCRFGDVPVWLAHGDFNQPLKYRLYTALIRHPVTLYLLQGIDRLGNGTILQRLENYLEAKEDCYEIGGFEAMAARHIAPLALPKGSVFVEGHYHQGKRFDIAGVRYHNLDAFACNRRYAVVSEAEDFRLEIRTFEEEI